MEGKEIKRESTIRNETEQTNAPLQNTFTNSIFEGYQINGTKEYPAED